MDSSSENSFAWTDTSSDSFGSNAMVTYKSNGNTEKNSNQNSKRRKEKKSLSKTANESEDEAKMDIKKEESYCETESNSSMKKKKIKLEPESDIDLPKKKKKIKHTEINGNQIDCEDSVSYDETYLHMKVKQEESSISSSNKQKQKKRKRQLSVDSNTPELKGRKKIKKNSISESYDEIVALKQESEHETESKSKKKKRNSKKHIDSDESDDCNLEIEDKIDIGETVINKQEQRHEIVGRNSQSNHTSSPATDNNSFEEESESGCDEISAIKCDDDHNLHTISFINKTTDDTNNSSNDRLKETTIRSSNKLSKARAAEQNSTEKSLASNHRTPRISDRIQFEDEDDTIMESSQVHDSDYESNKKSSKMKHFSKANPNLKLITQKFHNNSILTLDDEIWILKCPKEVDIKAFNDTSLKIHGKCKIKVNGQTYDGSAEEEQSDAITLLTMEHGKHIIRNLPLSGIINLRKRIPKAHFRDDNIMVNNQTNFIPLPETKCRHPLFGSNYKKALKIPAAIAERLNEQESEETLMKTEKRKKKKSKKNEKATEQGDTQIQSELILKAETDLSLEVSEKKRKKRKHADDEGPAPKRVKQIKHDPESAEAWESEKAIEENLFNF